MRGKAKSAHTQPAGLQEEKNKAGNGIVNNFFGAVDPADSTGLDEDEETGDAKTNNKPTRKNSS